MPFHVGELVPNGGQDGKQEVTGATRQGGGVGSLPHNEKIGGTFQARQGTAVCSEPIWFVVVGVDVVVVVVGVDVGMNESSVLDSGDVTGEWVRSSLILRDGTANPFR